jgi:hypothetical protein
MASRDTKAGRAAYNAYMREYMRKRYWRLKRQASLRRRWSPAEDSQVRAQYPHMKTAVIAAMLERPASSVYQAAARLGVEKSPEYMASPAACRLRRGDEVGKNHRFPKGHVPANKGTRRPGWAPGRMKETQFKAGQKNHNVMPVGTTRLIDGYVYIKVAAVRYVPYTVNWLPVHILGWERAAGRPMPPGHCLWFRDGDRMNVAVENLELITRAENMRRNTVHNLPKPLAEIVQLRGALVRQINRREKRDGKQQDRRPARDSVRHAARSPRQGEADGDRPGEGGS